MKAHFVTADRDTKNNIVFLEDLANTTGSRSITNDAESVVTHCRELYGNGIRIVYRDTDNEWWEIVWTLEHRGTEVSFRPWHGLAWDLLQRKEA